MHFAYGLFLLKVDETEEGVAQLQAELRMNPKNLIALLQIASVRSDENPAEAIQYAKKALAADPRLSFGHYLLGQFYLKAGDAQAAIPELEQARHDMQNDAQVYFALGNAYAKTGRKQEAAQARAEFRRLQASDEKESAPSIYGQEQQGVPAEGEGKPRE